MDNSDDGSDTESGTPAYSLGAFGIDTQRANFPSTVNILKPQIDKIFSEVEKNLPTIDFDLSDISSDNDEPIFFHQNLKLNELTSAFDDDKDLDTSLSQGEATQTFGLSGEETTLPAFTDDKNTPIADDGDADNEDEEEMTVYDNDLAALLSKAVFPSDNEITTWRSMAQKLEEDEREQERRDEEDLQRSRALGHFSSILTSMRQNRENQHQTSRSVSTGCGTDDFDPDVIYDNSHSMRGLDPDSIDLDIKDDSDDPLSLPPTVKRFNERLQQGQKMLDRGERRRLYTEKARSKDEEIVSKFSTEQPPTLSLRLFEDLDLDSVLNAANEENIPVTSLRVVGRPNPDQIPKSHEGAGDSNDVTDIPEEMTLIQKLAQLSLVQSGSDVKSVNSVHPHTGASLVPDSQCIITPPTSATAESRPEIAKGELTPDVKFGKDTTSKGATSSCAGTNTANSGGISKILYGRVKPEKKDFEPPTVFIDLRGFEKQKEAEKQGLESVQRVLGIGAVQSEEESSSDEEEMVERCNWRQTRQKMKEDLASQATPAQPATGRSGRGALSRPPYKQPPRVINLQEHAVSRTWAASQDTTGEDGGLTAEGEQEDNKEKMEKLEAEREKERQREEARKLREEREKERERRQRMSKHIEAARSLASTQGRQNAGENTPIVFDCEVSYEPAPTALPTTLTPERETLLLTVHLSSNGEIIQHRNRSSRSVDTGEGLSATYTALLSWLLSLVPHDFTFLASQPPRSGGLREVAGPTFHVVGLQQVWMEEELRLYVVVTPSNNFHADSGRHSRSKKGKQKDEIKGSSKFAQHLTKLLSVNTLYTVCPWLDTLVSVEMNSERPEDKNAPPYTYTPPLPNISTKPLSTFIQVNPDHNAARKVFNIPVGFFWQTVDNEEGLCDIECHDEDVNYETQNTMSLIYKKIFHNPLALMAILNRVSQEGLDLAGVRLLYPCPELMRQQNADPLPSSDLELLNNVGPVLALALRGTFARTIWLDAVGPADPQLARRTDPNSLCAQFGGESRDNALLFCPRNPSRVQSELTRWFGGRIPKGVSSVDVGVPYTRREEGRGKRGKKSNTAVDPNHGPLSTHRPPAALSATSKADIFLVLSPLVPASYFGVLMATGQRRGYQIRGVRRLQLTAKVAGSLGISSAVQAFFCPGAKLDDVCDDKPLEAIAPCTVFIMRKENAAHNTPSLIEAFMVQLALAGLLGCVQMRIDEGLTSKHLFHASTYTDGLLSLLGGNFAKGPEFDLSHLRLSSAISSKVSKDLEQMVIVILLGHDMLKKCGVTVGKILNVLPYSKTPVQPVLTERFELLGVKWTPSLSIHQAKELTPYEVGDRRWRQSVRQLATEPALVLALRGVNIFNRLKPVIEEQQTQESGSRGSQAWGSSPPSSSNSKDKKIDCMMSHNPSESDVFARLFFHQHELYPDPLARNLLPFLPESRLYFHIGDREEDGERVKVFTLKPLSELNLTQECVMDEMVAGQQPITTLMLIKPGAVQKYLARILKKVAQEQFIIVGLHLLVLDSEVADIFVPDSQKKDNTVRQQHIESLTSGPSLALALQHENAVKRLCDLVGPEEPMSARRQSQFLWRGEFGRDLVNNGLYCSGTYVDAVRDVKKLFPDGLCSMEMDVLAMEEIMAPANDSVIDVSSNICRQVSLTQQPEVDHPQHEASLEAIHQLLLQTTCIVLTPPLTKMNNRNKNVAGIDLLSILLSNGFELVGGRQVWLTQRQAECLLAVIGGGSFQQVNFLCSGPCLVLAMERDNAVLAFDSILNQSGEGLNFMRDYGNFVLRPHTIKQSHALVAFFFDNLMPGSQLTVQDKSHDSARNVSHVPGDSGVNQSSGATD